MDLILTRDVPAARKAIGRPDAGDPIMVVDLKTARLGKTRVIQRCGRTILADEAAVHPVVGVCVVDGDSGVLSVLIDRYRRRAEVRKSGERYWTGGCPHCRK